MSIIVKLRPTKTIIEDLGLQKDGPVNAFATSECAKEMDRYVPFDEGNLAGTVIVNGEPTENVGTSTITYDQKYAPVVYYGIRKGKEITIHKDKHPYATTYWDKHMWTAKESEIIDRCQKFLERGGK